MPSPEPTWNPREASREELLKEFLAARDVNLMLLNRLDRLNHQLKAARATKKGEKNARMGA